MDDGDSEPTLQPERVRASRAPAVAVLVVGVAVLIALVGVLPRVAGQPAQGDGRVAQVATSPAPTPEPSPEPMISGCGPSLDAGPTVVDTTGLIERCEIWPARRGFEGFFVTNPRDDPRILEVRWSGSECDLGSTFRFNSEVDRFQLVGDPPHVACSEPVAQHALRLYLSRPVLAASVSADFPKGLAPVPSTVPNH